MNMRKRVVMAVSAALLVTGLAISAEAQDQITITFWHSLGSEPSGEVINEFIPMYEEQHPDIKIDVQDFQSNDYQSRMLKVAVANGTHADVFHSYAAGYSKPFVEAGQVQELDDYFTELGVWDKLLDGSLEYMTYDGKVYGIPLTKWVGVMFCNTELFEKYEVDYPETWDDLMEAVKVFKEAGLVPICVGAKEGWHACLLQNAIAVRTAGAEYLNKALVGEETMDTPEIAKSAQLMIDLSEAGAFDPAVLGLSSDEADQEFMRGNIPMYYSGSWTSAQVTDPENAVCGKVKVITLPVVDGGLGDENQFLGGGTACYMINPNSDHVKEAVEFATALAEYQAIESYKRGDDVSCWKADLDPSEINPVLSEITEISKNATGYVLAWDTFLVGTAIDTHYTLVKELLGNAVTAEEFAAQSQAANVEALKLEE